MSTLREIARYEYTNASGDLLYTQVRFEPKDFRPQMPDGTWGLGTQRVLYRLPETLQAIVDGRPIWIVEGEKDANRMWSAGLPATTTGAASSWNSTDTSPLENARSIVIAPDADKAGGQYADKVALSLYQHTNVMVVKLIGAKGYDISDYLDEHTPIQLVKLASEAPYWEPPRHMRVKRRMHKRGKVGLPWDVGDIVWALGGKMYGNDRGVAYCPAHDDQGSENMGLSLSATMDERTIAHCHSGCDYQRIKKAVRKVMM